MSFRERSILLLDDFLKAKFLELFGNPITNTKKWEISKIGIECQVKGGKRIPKGTELVSENTGYPYIKAGNIKKGKITMDNLEFLTPELREKLKRYTVNKGDVCITVVGVNIGDIGIVPKELDSANLTENANKLLIRNKSRINNIYLAFYLMMDFVQTQFSSSIRASGVPKLALFRIEETDLLVPPFELQNSFAEIFEKTETIREAFARSKGELSELCSSINNKAFHGSLNIVENFGQIASDEIQVSNENRATERINKLLREFHENQLHTGAPNDIDNKIRQLETELKIRGEIPFWDEYVKYRLVKGKFKEAFTFGQLWQEISKFPFETLPEYDEVAAMLFRWLEEENSFIKQKFNETTKQIELIVDEVAKA